MIWNSATTEQQISFSLAANSALTIPAGTTSLIISVSDTNTVPIFVSPTTVFGEGIRLDEVVGPGWIHLGVDPLDLPTIYVVRTATASEEVNVVYFNG